MWNVCNRKVFLRNELNKNLISWLRIEMSLKNYYSMRLSSEWATLSASRACVLNQLFISRARGVRCFPWRGIRRWDDVDKHLYYIFIYIDECSFVFVSNSFHIYPEWLSNFYVFCFYSWKFGEQNYHSCRLTQKICVIHSLTWYIVNNC